jgi:hypothetical protein
MCDLSFLTEEDDEGTDSLSLVAKWGKELLRLREEFEAADEAAKYAKEAYDNYRTQFLPAQMSARGISSVALDNGMKVEVKTNYHCSPNKNEEDKQFLANWVKAHGGEEIINKELKVPYEYEEMLEKAGVLYKEVSEFNTGKLKAFLKDLIGASGGEASVQFDDIPACAHFIALDEVTIK